MGYDRTIEISTSKIKNRIATKKNWNENGRCDGFMLEKPHSNCDHFSFLGEIFFCAIWVAAAKAATRASTMIMIDSTFIFFFSY